jgi:hypothetical protein
LGGVLNYDEARTLVPVNEEEVEYSAIHVHGVAERIDT